MDPKRLRFSDLSSDSGGSSIKSSGRLSSRSIDSSTSSELILRLSTSFASISTASGQSASENRDGDSDFLVPFPVAAPPDSSTNPSRQSFTTTASGTTVWTAHGSAARTTIGIGITESTTRTTHSTETTEIIDPEAVKLRRRTVATVSSNNSCNSEDNSLTPTENLNKFSPINAQKKVVSIADDTDELPPTQPRGPLKDVVAYVEVFSGADNRSAIIGNVLRDLGATICQRFTNKVTHVAFREGRQSTIERARSRNVYLVSVLWVDKCQRENERATETDYQITQLETVTPHILGKQRRLRSMQPKPMEAELALTDKSVRKRKQRLDAYKQKREIIKDIREGRLVGRTPTIDCNSAPRTPSLEKSNRAAVSTGISGRISLVDDETPESLRKQVADVRKKILGDMETPQSRRNSQQVGSPETVAESVRKRLFAVAGRLRGSPVPTSSNRPRAKSASSAGSGARTDRQTNQASRRLCDLSEDGSLTIDSSAVQAVTESNNETNDFSKIDGVVAAVCERVSRMEIDTNRITQSTRRRILYDRNSERLSDGMFNTPESTDGQNTTDEFLSTTVQDKTKNPLMDVDSQAFIAEKSGARKTKSKKVKNKEETVRLRSSIFQVKSSFDIVRQLQVNRRSSEEFCTLVPTRKEKRGKSTKPKKQDPIDDATVFSKTNGTKTNSQRRRSTKSLAMTNLKSEDREMVRAIVKRLKGFRVENKVTVDTTHVICGDNKRTLTVLMGVARGCWMMPLEWVYRSLINRDWLDEEELEMADQFPAAQIVRKRRKPGQSDFAFSTTSGLFSTLGSFFVSPSSQPPFIDLCALIRWSGGKISLTSKRASHCVGCATTHENSVGVKETWILDSIMEQKVLSVDEYRIK